VSTCPIGCICRTAPLDESMPETTEQAVQRVIAENTLSNLTPQDDTRTCPLDVTSVSIQADQPEETPESTQDQHDRGDRLSIADVEPGFVAGLLEVWAAAVPVAEWLRSEYPGEMIAERLIAAVDRLENGPR